MEFDACFAGDLRRFELVVAPEGAPFRRRVWAALAGVPCSETRSCWELARRTGLGRRMARGAGAANGANPIAVVLPSHRVVGAGGSLVGYGGGLDRKARFLAHEPVFESPSRRMA